MPVTASDVAVGRELKEPRKVPVPGGEDAVQTHAPYVIPEGTKVTKAGLKKDYGVTAEQYDRLVEIGVIVDAVETVEVPESTEEEASQ